MWALRDVSFEVKQGEILGIIGRNGAGKSTLLKILSRVTAPTSGEVRVKGRIASLLEVGTGFHPELTGRENIFLNGAILGMTKAEIKGKFDEIVAFSEIEKFLDTPVKRYSSGMYVRLAFAVAAHLEPEILIVDEVLAVGDAAFQKKCLGKMGDVAKEGRTVLFVSHNMAAIQKLCGRVLLLAGGKNIFDGANAAAISHYLTSPKETRYVPTKRNNSNLPHFLSAELLDHAGSTTTKPLSSNPVIFSIEWVVPCPTMGLRVGIGINSKEGVRIFGSAPEDCGMEVPTSPGWYQARVHVPANIFLAYSYTIALCLWNQSQVFDYPDPALSFSVERGPSLAYANDSGREGLIQLRCEWDVLVKSLNEHPTSKTIP